MPVIRLDRRLLALAAALLALPLIPSIAQADNTADEADLRFRRGVDFYRQRRFEDALAEFFSSNRLVKNRNVILNIARCFEQLKQYEEAYRYYYEVLGESPSKEDKQVVDDSLARLAPRVALLQVDSDPPGADVYIDRKDLGSRGLTPRALALPPGKVRVILSLAGHRDATREVEVAQGTQAKVKLPLEFIYGYVVMKGTPEGAAVRVDKSDGEPDGVVPGRLTVKPGRHILNVGAEGFISVQVPVDALPDQPREVSVALAPLPPPTGNLVVTANRDGALVKVDGKETGFTPVVLPLTEGRHKVTVSFEDLKPFEEEVKMKVGEQTWVKADLRYDQAKVTAASKTETSVEDAPASITVITREQIQAFGYTTLPEALRSVRGVFTSNDRTYEILGVRGFSPPGDLNNRILVLYDGHPMNDVWAGQAYVGRENNVDLGEVERIEVVRGPVSSLFGSAAFFGVINIVPRHSLGEQVAEVTAAGGKQSEGRGRATVGMKADKAEVIASFAGVYAQGQDRLLLNGPDGPIASRFRDGEKALNGTARARYGNLSLFGSINSRNKEIPTAPFGTVQDQPSARGIDTRAFLEARYDLAGEGGSGLTARGYYDATRFRGEYLQEAPLGQEIDTGGADWVGAEVRYRTAEILNQHLTAGVELQRQLRVFQTVDYGDENGLPYKPLGFTIASGFLVDELRLGSRVLINGSVRADEYLGSFGLTVNPRLAIIVRPYSTGITKLMGGKSFRAPTVYERFYSDNNVTSRENPGVRPEEILTAELEHTHDLTNEVRLVGAVFVNRVTNLIHSVIGPAGCSADEAETDPARRCLAESDNAKGSVFTEGAEAEIRWQPARLTLVSASYWVQRMDLKGLEDDDAHSEEKRLRANAPRHAFALKAMFPLIAPSLNGAVELVYNSARFTLDGRGAAPVGEFLLVNLGLSGETTNHRLRYYAGVQNLLDEKPLLPIGPDARLPLIPLYGRTFQVQLSAAY